SLVTSLSPSGLYFFVHCFCDLLYLLSFSTRRSSDLSWGWTTTRSRTTRTKCEPNGSSPVRAFRTPCCARPSSTTWCSRSSPGCRSEEHTSELQSREKLVCRLLLEKKIQDLINNINHI